MTSQMLEIVELENGDIVLRYSDEPKETLLMIKFSETLSDYVDGIKLQIAKAMIQAGSNAYGDIVRSEVAVEASEQASQPVIH